MRLIFRADANPSIGAGHVMRLTSIIEESISRGFETYFVGLIEHLDWVLERLIEINGLNIVGQSIRFVPDRNSDILILDSYNLDVGDPFLNPSRWKSVVTLIDELTPPYKSNLKIHPGLSTDWPTEMRVLCGPNFIPIRKKVSQPNQSTKEEKLKIVIVGGGTDLFGFSSSIGKFLINLNFDFAATIFLRHESSIPFQDPRFEFQEIGNGLDKKTEVADLIVTTASTTCLEFIASERAIGVFCGIDNQLDYYKNITENGLAAPLGRYEDGDWSINSDIFTKLITEDSFRKSFQNRTVGFIDGKGSQRILDEIQKL